jgi:uncharacterized membrane protein
MNVSTIRREVENMYRYIGYTGGMTGIGMFFVVVAVVLLVVILSVVLYKVLANKSSKNEKHEVPTKEEDIAIELLRQEYAKGSINEEEYVKRKTFLINN